jgi:hypothetical protein
MTNMRTSFFRKAAVALVLFTCLFLSTRSFAQPSGGYAASRKMLLRDEGLSQISYVNLADPKDDWYVKVPLGRDLQLIGNGMILVPTSDGYQVHDIKTGNKLRELTGFPNTQTAHMLKNGNILMIGLNYNGKKGIVLDEVDEKGAVKKELNFPEYDYVRMVRETPAGTYLVTANKKVFEADTSGKIIWQADVTGGQPAHTNCWQAQRLPNGETLVAGGYAGNFQVFDKDGKQVKIITGPAEVHPNFFAGYQILANGNYVVTNWQGHGPSFGTSGHQVIEYSPDGNRVWSWKQYADKFSSLQGVIVLDGLDPNLAYVEGPKGSLVPLKK